MSSKYTLLNYMNTFDVKGNFYNINIINKEKNIEFKCRNILTIERIGENSSKVDAIVVMMNPGSSIPINKDFNIPIYDVESIVKDGIRLNLVHTKPDNVQVYVMEIMDRKGWNLVNVVNLSDIRNANSSEFKKDIKYFKELANNINKEYNDIHSIFSRYRVKDRKIIILNDRPIICAFGVSNPKYLTNNLVNFLKENDINPIGKCKDKDFSKFFYLKPIGGKDIVDEIIELI